MVQQVATTRLDIAAPSGTSIDADVKTNEGEGNHFSLQLADAQSGHNAPVVRSSKAERSDKFSIPEPAKPASVQAPQDDDVVTDENIAVDVVEEQIGQEVDQDLLRFLRQLNQNNGGYDPTDTSGKKQDGGILQNLNGDEPEIDRDSVVSILNDSHEQTPDNTGVTGDFLASIHRAQSDNTPETPETDVTEVDIEFENLLGINYSAESQEVQDNEKPIVFSTFTQPEQSQPSEGIQENDDALIGSLDEPIIEIENLVNTEQLESVALHQPVIETPTTQSQQPDSSLLSTQRGVSDNNIEQDVESTVNPVNEIVVQSLLQASPEQQENAFNQISAVAGLNVAEKAAKDFVAGLKAGFEDIKARYQAGQDVSNDLTQLVSQVAESLQESGQLTEQQLSQVTQAVGQYSQTYASQGDGAFQSLLTRADGRIGAAALGVEQLEANKTAQHNSAFEKAVNLAKPEAAVQLAEKVSFAVNARNLVADIRLDPADLGSVQARVSLQGDQATVNFVTQSQQARDLLEQQTPKLRELLDEQGIELGQSSVQQESQQTQDGESGGSLASNNASGQPVNSVGAEASLEEIAESPINNGHVGAIDYFV